MFFLLYNFHLHQRKNDFVVRRSVYSTALFTIYNKVSKNELGVGVVYGMRRGVLHKPATFTFDTFKAI